MALGCLYIGTFLPGEESTKISKVAPHKAAKQLAQLFLDLFKSPIILNTHKSICRENWSTRKFFPGYLTRSQIALRLIWVVDLFFKSPELVPRGAKHFHNLFSQSIIKSRWLVRCFLSGKQVLAFASGLSHQIPSSFAQWYHHQSSH